MKKFLQLVVIAILLVTDGYGQSNLWEKVSSDRLIDLPKMERATMPNQYELFSLDFNGLKSQLQNAPLENSNLKSNVIITFPNPKGEFSNFRIFESPVMEQGLSNKFPGIKSYTGIGIDNPASRIRFSITLFGLHLMSLSGDSGTYYIDTYTKDLNNYIIYSRKNISNSRSFTCLFQDEETEVVKILEVSNFQRATDGKFRQYRLAMACTIEYAAFHVNAAGLGGGTLAQKKAAVLSAMVVTMTRVNGVYERDMSLRMNLVANNDLVIFITTDNFSNTNASTLINESQTEIDAVIGSANYDIGHTVSTGGGGLAQLGVPCTASKARGITGSPAPVGDPYDIDYVAHEMGHQFGGPHTFNGTGGSCTGNRSAADAVEPGSGSTIMAYAGICTGVDVQSNSDAYFHAVSIAKMNAFMISTGNCAAQANNNNTPPLIDPLTNYTIPYGTAYILKGNGTDDDGAASLTYCWEQINPGTSTASATPTSTNTPNFRSLNPSTSPNRYLPKFSDVLAGNLNPTWEMISNVARTLNFSLTVRDNQTPTGGQTARRDMIVNVVNVGPFTITSPNIENVTWNQGSSQTITWNVAGTTANGINTANVNILLSTDGGLTFPTILAANTPNDGSQTITLPNGVASPSCRVMIEAVGNIYYAVTKNVSIGYTFISTCITYTNNTPLPVPDGTGANVPGATVSKTISVPDSGIISDVNVTLDGTHTYFWDLITGINHPDGTQVLLLNRNCNQVSTGFNVLFNDASPAIVCAANLTGTFKPNQLLSAFNGKSMNGIWTLLANDNYNGDTGTINDWAIEICALIPTLNTQENIGFNNFVVYPNPNNGNFNIQFTSNSTKDINVTVHDIRGREILKKKYGNNGMFNENIQLNNVQKGIYLLTISDGNSREVKKILIE